MRKRIVPLIIILIVIAAAVEIWWYVRAHPEEWSKALEELGLSVTEEVTEGLSLSGTIEAEEITISSQTGGLIKAIYVDEGDKVTEGQLLVEMDTELLDVQIRQAKAALQMAEAQLALLKAGVREEDIRKAEAQLAQARAAREGAKQLWEDAKAILENPQDLDAQIHSIEGQIEALEHSLKAAYAQIQAAETENSMYEEIIRGLEEGFVIQIPLPYGGVITKKIEAPRYQLDELYYQWNLSSQRLSQAWEEYNSLKASLEDAKRTLALLREMRNNPLALEEQVHKAESAYHTAEAAVKMAQAQLDALKAGASEEEIKAAEANVERAKAALEALEARREKTKLYAPTDGWVTELVAKKGEIVAPGATILKIANLDEVTLTVYVPEPDLGKVHLGQKVSVTVDSFPGEVFEGQVAYISSKAEFTPKNIQTKEERVNLVFAVKVKLPNPEHKLKAGMPADAVIE
ncbi:MAG: hypothetical protein DRI61_07245 [Chloroflexi bacterium]|nr:MAG: hypothetical protein DRI61_07245 [Chloroflexota bacterium]